MDANSRTLGVSMWTVQITHKERKDGDKVIHSFAVTGRRSFDIKDKLKSVFKGARYNGEDKSWSFTTEKEELEVYRMIENWMEDGRRETREMFREQRQTNAECDCYIGDKGRIGREPGKPHCFLSARNDWPEQRERQRENFERYRKRNKSDERWSDSSDAECVACGVNLFGSTRTTHYNRRLNACYHCEWNLEDE